MEYRECQSAWEGCWSILLDITSVQYHERGESKDDEVATAQSLLSAELNRDQASEMRVDALVLFCSARCHEACDANSAAQDFKTRCLC